MFAPEILAIYLWQVELYVSNHLEQMPVPDFYVLYQVVRLAFSADMGFY
jgi:hypothetical protein